MSPARKFCFLLFVFLLAACNSAASTSQAEPLRIQYTFAAQTWLTNLTDCAGANVVNPELRSVDSFDFSVLDLAIRIGDKNIATPAYQIDTEEILVIVNTQNPVSALSLEEALGLFSGQIANWQSITGSDAPVQVWVFSADEDVQQIFEQTVLSSAPVTSRARLASGPDEMAQAVAEDVHGVGILTRHWVAGNVSAVYTAASVPVLALTPSEPSEVASEIIACLQK